MAIQDIDQYIEALPKSRRDWLEVYGNQWGEPTKVMPGTCEACVWGRGEHVCKPVETRGEFHDVLLADIRAWDAAQANVKLQGQLNAYMNGQIEIK